MSESKTKQNIIGHSAMHFIFISVVSDFFCLFVALLYSLFVDCINLLRFSLLILAKLNVRSLFKTFPFSIPIRRIFILMVPFFPRHSYSQSESNCSYHSYAVNIRISNPNKLWSSNCSFTFFNLIYVFFSRVSVGISIISFQSRSIYSKI